MRSSVPRGARPGLIMLALAAGAFAIGTTEFAAMGLLPFFARDLGIDEPTAGHAISAYALGVVVGAPIIAVLSARIARRTLLIGLMTMFALGNALSAVSQSYHEMILFRFLSGLPHGAYFGIAALVIASLVEPGRRTRAISRMFLGLTIATIIGVPLSSWFAQAVGWRWSFVIVAALGLLTATLVALWAPADKPDSAASPLRELGALARGQVWLTLVTAAIGFGGLFAVYTYLSVTLVEVTGVTPAFVPVVLAVFGIGMTVGNLVVPPFADRALMPTAAGLLIFSAASMALFPLAAHNPWAVMANVFVIGWGGSLGSLLQTRLMEVAEDAQSLAAALNHSAFNVANALGPWLAGLAISAGFGWTSIGWVGCALSLGGLPTLVLSVMLERKRRLRYAAAS
ncbi:MFS transporter [Pedomonas mirosovicensis]|uniref:MFS transporter n=1 Tax=Pedomonas mirosovicensis TaxID=2908641 RepID=UPI002168CDD9|nr:MFS transporter [Pedomonas mirosovicensis]MCH8686571.1 MFS transporter [Pedomonas mirosovicensis]